MQETKPKWFVEPIKKDKVHHGCLNCGGTELILNLKTKLYNGFGGWHITKDGVMFFSEDPSVEKKWEDLKDMTYIEKIAKKEPDHDWRAIFEMGLRGGAYQRHGNKKWVLIESNQGFA